MFLTLKEATDRIRDAENKPPIKSESYYNTFIYPLLKSGKLKQSQPDKVFYRTDQGDYIELGDVRVSTMVCEQSVVDYIASRKKTPKAGKPIVAVFRDGSTSKFGTMSSACKFFDINYERLQRALRTNTCVCVPVSKKRLIELDIADSEIEDITECVKFKRV